MKIYLVGGSVRDRLLGLPASDRDYVVVGATPEQMLASGYQPVGKDFPVFLHPQTHEEYALARTERKSGRGYLGFTVQAAPDVTLEDDLARRDLTINAIAEDPATAIRTWGGLFGKTLTWEDLPWLRSVTKLPIVLKGICHPDDARERRGHAQRGRRPSRACAGCPCPDHQFGTHLRQQPRCDRRVAHHRTRQPLRAEQGRAGTRRTRQRQPPELGEHHALVAEHVAWALAQADDRAP